MRRIISGIAISLTAIIISLVVIEAGLRIAGFFYHKEVAAARNVNKDIFLVYCFGDSFTYGVGSENKKGYPEKLQELCDQRFPGKNIKIVNFGIPGSNSTQALNDFKRILAYGHLKPDLVILMTGMNDWWNISDNNQVLSYRKMNPFAVKCCMALMRFKIVKLFTMGFADKVHMRIGTQTAIADPNDPKARKRLGNKYRDTVRMIFEQNVNEFVKLACSFGIEIVFSQYPGGFIFDPSLRNIAKKQNITMVYNYANFKEFIDSGRREEFFSPKYSYSHPNEKGYAIMAEDILATLIKSKQI